MFQVGGLSLVTADIDNNGAAGSILTNHSTVKTNDIWKLLRIRRNFPQTQESFLIFCFHATIAVYLFCSNAAVYSNLQRAVLQSEDRA